MNTSTMPELTISKFTPLEYLQMALAVSCIGDKITWEERLIYTSNIKNTPYDDLLNNAKDKFMFIKLYEVYQKVIEAQEQGVESIPAQFMVMLDATSSNAQIASVLMGCEVSARNTNAINTGKRENLHGKILKYVKESFGVDLDPDDTKTAIVSALFGSVDRPEKLLGKGTKELKAFLSALDEFVPASIKLLRITKSIWDREALRYRWVMPDGFEVVYNVMATKTDNLSIPGIPEVSYRSKQNMPLNRSVALAAHVVHSVEAFIVRTIKGKFSRKSIITNHDCFATSPIYAQKLREDYKEIMIDIANSDLLQNILRQITNNPNLVFNKQDKNMYKLMYDSEYMLS